jgi:hypothetical protein
MTKPEIFVVPASGDHGIATLPRDVRAFGTVQVGEDTDHPFGQWSAVLTRTKIDGAPGPGVFRLTFMSDEAPIDKLESDVHIKFFRAPILIGTLQVLLSPRRSEIVDRDVLLMPGAPARVSVQPAAL